MTGRYRLPNNLAVSLSDVDTGVDPLNPTTGANAGATDSAGNRYTKDNAVSEGQAAGSDFDTLNAMPICDGGAQITTATTTTVENGPCVLSGIQILAAVASTITIYDNTAGSGTVIATLPASLAVGYYPFNRLCAIGLTIVTAGASNMLVHTRKATP